MRTGDVETQRKATDAFIAERELQTKTSRSARKWEEDRKKEIAKNKPLWRKKKDKSIQDSVNKSWEKLLEAGVFNSGISPAPGYVLIGIDRQDVSESGIVIAQTEESNTGVVLDVGGDLVVEPRVVVCPCKKGDKILFKRGAGLSLTLKNRDCKLIYFSDILGTFK
jgi:co-chaperonin GroES (HSP10)